MQQVQSSPLQENNQPVSLLSTWVQQLPDPSIVRQQLDWAQSSQSKLRLSHIVSTCGSFLLGMYGTFGWLNLWMHPVSIGLASLVTLTAWTSSYCYGDGTEWKKASVACCMTFCLGLLVGGCSVGLSVSSRIASATRLVILSACLPTTLLGSGIVGYVLYRMYYGPNCYQLRARQLIDAVERTNLEEISRLIKKTLLNKKDLSGRSALTIVFQKGKMDLFAEYLIKSGWEPTELLKDILAEAIGSGNFAKLHRLSIIIPDEFKHHLALEKQIDNILNGWPQEQGDFRNKNYYQLFEVLIENKWLTTPRIAIKERILANRDQLPEKQLKNYIQLLQQMGWIQPQDSFRYQFLENINGKEVVTPSERLVV